jgi:crossover junction endodeoxyribonuclease RusA
VKIIAYGSPAAQGSKKYVGRSAAGAGIMIESSAKVLPWRQDVKAAAEAVLDSLGRPPPFLGPLVVRMVFTFLRPVSVKRHKRPYPSVAPDLSKLCRSTEDALKQAGVIHDDALIVEYTRLAKVYAEEDPDALDRSGVLIIIGELVDSIPIQGTPPRRTRKVA